jgi:hypothetical protein
MGQTMRYVKLWVGLALVVRGSFAILGYHGFDLYSSAPPVPAMVVAMRRAPKRSAPPRRLRAPARDAREAALVN